MNGKKAVTIDTVDSPDEIAEVRNLLEEYAAWLGEAHCFRNTDHENESNGKRSPIR